jgi:hypothetical protein
VSAPASYILKQPITFMLRGPEGEREETIAAGTELSLRRVKGKDLRVTDDHAGDVAKTFALLSKITDQPIHVIDAMDAEDIAGLGELLDRFLPASLRTGQTSSGT